MIDCYDCGGYFTVGKYCFCSHNQKQKIIVLPMYGKCTLKPNKAQTKLK